MPGASATARLNKAKARKLRAVRAQRVRIGVLRQRCAANEAAPATANPTSQNSSVSNQCRPATADAEDDEDSVALSVVLVIKIKSEPHAL